MNITILPMSMKRAMTRLPNPPACWPFDPSVEGRFKLYKASMDDLLNPSKRAPKITLFNRDVVIKLFPKLSDGNVERYLDATIVFPEGHALLTNRKFPP